MVQVQGSWPTSRGPGKVRFRARADTVDDINPA